MNLLLLNPEGELRQTPPLRRMKPVVIYPAAILLMVSLAIPQGVPFAVLSFLDRCYQAIYSPMNLSIAIPVLVFIFSLQYHHEIATWPQRLSNWLLSSFQSVLHDICWELRLLGAEFEALWVSINGIFDIAPDRILSGATHFVDETWWEINNYMIQPALESVQRRWDLLQQFPVPLAIKQIWWSIRYPSYRVEYLRSVSKEHVITVLVSLPIILSTIYYFIHASIASIQSGTPLITGWDEIKQMSVEFALVSLVSAIFFIYPAVPKAGTFLLSFIAVISTAHFLRKAGILAPSDGNITNEVVALISAPLPLIGFIFGWGALHTRVLGSWSSLQLEERRQLVTSLQMASSVAANTSYKWVHSKLKTGQLYLLENPLEVASQSVTNLPAKVLGLSLCVFNFDILTCTKSAVINISVIAVVSAIGISQIIFLKAASSIHRPYNPLPLLFSFTKWGPTLWAVFFTLGYKALQHFTFQSFMDQARSNYWLLNFVILFIFKFLKIFVHTFSFYFITKPASKPIHPTILPRDVTVIVPTVGELDAEFEECIETILANAPHQVIISTVNLDKLNKANEVCGRINARHNNRKMFAVAITETNKRAQFLKAASYVETEIIAYADDHVFWPPTFLKSSLANFEDPQVGIVGTAKSVRRDRSGGFFLSVLNYFACLYLERHNFECTATYNLDGGVFVISGRTALTRTVIIHDVEFRKGFLSEMWFWGLVGPLKVDDDNFITRWMVAHGWKTVFHNSPDAVVETTLSITGGATKFKGQLIRWVRTTWRSNSTSLFAVNAVWSAHPWTTYSMFISSFLHMPLVFDPLLIYSLYHSGYRHYVCTLLLLIFVSKLIKPLEHLRKEPKDLFLVPLGILFGYFHSAVKIYALFTAGDIAWSGRSGIAATREN
jgi:cellulose synthase/poly-beta-1,6-N-acetylglucosamine synthase-like glycosyltransferase